MVGTIAASVLLSCINVGCWCRQRRRIQTLEQRVSMLETRPVQQIRLVTQETGYGQAFYPPPTYHPPPAPSAPYETRII